MANKLKIIWTIVGVLFFVIGLGGLADDIETWAGWISGISGVVRHPSLGWAVVTLAGGLLGIVCAWFPWPKRRRNKKVAPTRTGLAGKFDAVREWMRNKPVVWAPASAFAVAVAIAAILNVLSIREGKATSNDAANQTQAAANGTLPVTTASAVEIKVPPIRKTTTTPLKPEVIIAELEEARAFEREEIRAKYRGTDVAWICDLMSVDVRDDGVIDLQFQYQFEPPSSVLYPGYNGPGPLMKAGKSEIVARVVKSEYPGLETLKPKHRMRVSGLIDEIFDGSAFRLRGVQLYFEP